MLTSFLLSITLMATSCSKNENDSGSQAPPQALSVDAKINAINNGTVAFTATAVNASTYRYDYGDGQSQIIPTGTVTHTYAQSGIYDIKVTAINSADSISKTIRINVNVLENNNVLLFSDEFNTPGAPDPNKWTYEIGTGDNGWGNAEAQYYTDRPENIIVEDGVLKIKAIKENYNGSTFTSARIKTQNKFDFTYGRVEIRAKAPVGSGSWAAGWMLGSNFATVGWPECGEIDILEYLGRDVNNVYSTLHYPGRFGGNANGNAKKITNAAEEFHVYSVDWNADHIIFYVDGEIIHSFTNSASVPFNHDFFIILNLAIGGNFGGAIDPALTNATYEVDYVRVYAN